MFFIAFTFTIALLLFLLHCSYSKYIFVFRTLPRILAKLKMTLIHKRFVGTSNGLVVIKITPMSLHSVLLNCAPVVLHHMHVIAAHCTVEYC